MKNIDDKKDKSFLLALLLFVGAGLLLYMSWEPSLSSRSSAVDKVNKLEESVNKHLTSTNDRIEFSRQRMALENARAAKDLRETVAQPTYLPERSGVDLSTDPRGYEIANELGRGSRFESMPSSPDEEIQKELFNAQQNAEYTKAYKDEYARQFIENARKGGWLVELNDDYKVISVRPIRKPSQSMELFESSPSGDLLR